ncbi:MAG: TetR family transcriptional regulator [Rhodospirillaceae bacterium]|nr:TetR family transcriptional regulator [Rhodospirillaceae bacterium]
MARTQSENYPEIRREILRKSAAVFARQGYSNTTIADLAKANGISRGLLYHYFESKEQLLAEMLNEHLDMLLAEVRRASACGADIEARIAGTIRTMVAINAHSKDLQVVLLHDLQNLHTTERKAIVAKQKEILACLSALIQKADGGRKIDARTLKAYTMMFVGMINYTYLWFDPDGPVRPEEYADMVVETCLAGLRA